MLKRYHIYSWNTRNRPSVQLSCSVVSDSVTPWIAALQASLSIPDPCPSSWWCHPTISSSVVPLSYLQSFPASGSFPMSHIFTSGGQSTGDSASASVLPMNIQDWFPLRLTSLISLLSKGVSRVFSNILIDCNKIKIVQ